MNTMLVTIFPLAILIVIVLLVIMLVMMLTPLLLVSRCGVSAPWSGPRPYAIDSSPAPGIYAVIGNLSQLHRLIKSKSPYIRFLLGKVAGRWRNTGEVGNDVTVVYHVRDADETIARGNDRTGEEAF